MRYYKIYKDGMVVDANFVFLKWTQNGMGLKFLETCNIEEAQYIQSSDQKEIYRVNWLNPVKDNGQFEVVEATLIDEAEYREIRQQLDESKEPIPDPIPESDSDPSLEPIPEPYPEPVDDEVMTLEIMRREILGLKEELRQKEERIGYLEEAMVDVGGILYGGDDV